MMDMALREENLDVILAAITDYYVREIEFWCKTDVDGIAYMDDWGSQQALLIDPLAEKVRASVMPAFAEGLEVKAAALQNDAGLVGAVYYFREMHER